MATDIREERRQRCIADLAATDPQFAAACPDPAVTAAVEQPDLRLPQIIRTVMGGHLERPALGQRVVEFLTDPQFHQRRLHHY